MESPYKKFEATPANSLAMQDLWKELHSVNGEVSELSAESLGKVLSHLGYIDFYQVGIFETEDNGAPKQSRFNFTDEGLKALKSGDIIVALKKPIERHRKTRKLIQHLRWAVGFAVSIAFMTWLRTVLSH